MRIGWRAAGIAALAGVVIVLATAPLAARAARHTPAVSHEVQGATVGETVQIGSTRLFNSAGESQGVTWKDDPPIGVTVQTLSADPRAAIWIDGEPVPGTSDRGGIFVDVLKRSDRQQVPLRSRMVSRDTGGIKQLMGIEQEYADKGSVGDYLMIVSGATGLPPNDVAAFDKLAQSIGARELTDAQKAGLAAGAPFSIIGIPGGAKDSAWVKIANLFQSGDITGYLQRSGVTLRYDYVNPDMPTFDTQAIGSVPGRNVIRVGNREYEARLPGGARDGFQILALNPDTLDEVDNLAFDTNLPATVNSQQNAVADAFKRIAKINPAPLVFVQSIGNPQALRKGWASAADEIQTLGGTRLVFNAVDGQRHYALVGRAGYEASAIELSSDSGDDGLVGGLSRSHDFSFLPTVGGPLGGLHPELISMAYQPSKPFPAFSTPEQQAAETYLGDHATMCEDKAPVCDIRPLYYKLDPGQLKLDEGRLRDVPWPGPGHGLGDNSKVFDEVKAQLVFELQAVNDVYLYFQHLQKIFGNASQAGRIPLKDIVDAVKGDINPPQSSENRADILELMSKVAGFSSVLGPEAAAVGKGIGATMELLAYATRTGGGPLLADPIQSKADELAKELQDRMFEADNMMIDLAHLFVSDYGKLTDLNAKLKTTAWQLGGEPPIKALNDITLASRQWVAEQLVPLADPWLIRGTPPPVGPGDANGLSCRAYSEGLPHQAHPWKDEPALAQIRAVEGWEDNGVPIRPSFFFSKRGEGGDWPFEDQAPSQKLAELLFGRSTNTTTGPLGLSRLEFLSPAVFGKLLRANDTADYCDLPR